MRVYKIKGFVRFQRREHIADTALVEAISAAERGLVDADLAADSLNSVSRARDKERAAGFGR